MTPVSITSTSINSSNVLTVFGSGFATGATPTFIFNGHSLTVKSFNNTLVSATLPSGTSQGSYQVTIRNSQGQSATVSTSVDVDPALVTDSSLKGNGTGGTPLGIAVPLILSGSVSDTPIASVSNGNGPAISATSGPGYYGISVTGGAGGDGVGGSGGSFTGGNATTGNGTGGDGVDGNGGEGPGGGIGVLAIGGAALSGGSGLGGVGILAQGGVNSDQTTRNAAGNFLGDVEIFGNLSKSGGSFKIDHPLDPANKYLSHSFVESPDMKNMYDGSIVTDRTGIAVVTLPDWFEALNRDFRYQLTVIGQFAQAIIAREVINNQFIIRTDKPSVKVSWQITGIRQDAWANAHRIPVEEEKPEKERDHYLHPELFNQPADKSIEWERHPEAQKKLAEERLKALSIGAQHTAQ